MTHDIEQLISAAAKQGGCTPDGVRLIGRSLDVAIKLQEHRTGTKTHVTAQDVCHAVRKVAVADYGFFARSVLDY